MKRRTARNSSAAVNSEITRLSQRMFSPYSIIAARSGASCSVTSIIMPPPLTGWPITRITRSSVRAIAVSASAISFTKPSLRRSKLSATSAGKSLDRISSRRLFRRSTTFSTSAFLSSSSSRSVETMSSGVASRASEAIWLSSSRSCR